MLQSGISESPDVYTLYITVTLVCHEIRVFFI